MMSDPALSLLVSASGVLLLAALVHDVAFRTVPNWISLVLGVLGVLRHLPQGNLAAALACAALVFGGATFCWLRGWMGGGDVKLLGAAALVIPPAATLDMVLCIALAGGVLALLYIALGRVVAAPRGARPRALLARIWRTERYRMHRRGPLPYASAIAAGALFVLVKG